MLAFECTQLHFILILKPVLEFQEGTGLTCVSLITGIKISLWHCNMAKLQTLENPGPLVFEKWGMGWGGGYSSYLVWQHRLGDTEEKIFLNLESKKCPV